MYVKETGILGNLGGFFLQITTTKKDKRMCTLGNQKERKRMQDLYTKRGLDFLLNFFVKRLTCFYFLYFVFSGQHHSVLGENH